MDKSLVCDSTDNFRKKDLSWISCQENYIPYDVIFDHVDTFADINPDRYALVDSSRSYTYKNLKQYTDGLAQYLLSLGYVKGSAIAVYVNRNVNISLSLLAIFKAGFVYVPIDPAMPKDRIRFILDDANIQAVLTESSKYSSLLSATENKFDIVVLNDELGDASKFIRPLVSGDDLAYIIYTSGSTGVPKGVAIQHRKLSNQILGWQQFTPAYENLSGTLIAGFGFDNSLWEHFFTLAWGGTLHILDDVTIKSALNLAKYLSKHKIVSTNIPPALLEGVLYVYEKGEMPFYLKRLVAGGESVPCSIYQRYRNISPNLELIVGYGPTEAAITATVFRFDNDDAQYQNVPIGKPLPGYTVYIVDENDVLVKPCEVGELLIAGDHVLATGYIGCDDLTKKSFVKDIFSKRPSARMYRTGDLAKILDDGNIQFIGRRDNQIKIRGIRIEIGEIESAMLNISSARSVAVIIDNTSGFSQIFCYLESPRVSRLEIKINAAKKLPAYMMPSAIVILDKMPLNLNNKIDKKALPFPSYEDMAVKPFKKPENAIQEYICIAWCRLLKIDKVGVADSFFDMGGSSLLFVNMLMELCEKYEIDPNQVSFMDLLTVEKIAKKIEDSINN